VRNEPDGNHWLQLDLAGDGGNPQAIGAWVEVEAGDRKQVNPVGHAEGSFFSQGHYRVYFGLGPEETVETVRVHWPDGRVQEIENVATDRRLVIVRDAEAAESDVADPDVPQ
jgi:hypothetical protein